MDVLARAAPPPGSAQAGDLYVDLQSRTLWLGVDPAVDPAQFVLISDIVALQDQIEGSLIEAKAYTDTRIATRALTVHTHTSTQITDFTAAVTAVATSIPSLSYTRGMIIMYSGLLSDIGIGPLAGWALCDGANGTPDLRDKFILAAGSRVIGSTNPNSSLAIASSGDHSHSINATAITLAQMPSHYHGGNTGYISHDHAHNVNINTGTESNFHHHEITGPATQSTSGGARPSGSGGSSNSATTNNVQLHWHNVSGGTGGVTSNHYHSIPAEGSNQGHTHTIVGGGGQHTHSILSINIREAIPFYALAFIMKL